MAQIGGSFGTAVLAVILESAVTVHHGDFASGFDTAFSWSVGFAAVAVLLSLWLPRSLSAPPQEPAGCETTEAVPDR